MYYAHSSEHADKHDWQPLQNHLFSVGDLAARFAAPFGGEDLARAEGRLHDLGKYTGPFQHRLEGGPRVDHATRGAEVARTRWGSVGQLLAYGIAGHHAGLANGRMGTDGASRTSLSDRLAVERLQQLPELDPQWRREIDLPDELVLPRAFESAPAMPWFQVAFLVRMLFSCLVDADFIDTDNYYRGLKGEPARGLGGWPSLARLRGTLDAHLAALQAGATGNVNALRAQILRDARAGAALDPGLFSLTVPTGGGKTLASLAFALDHAIRHGLERVIYVIPYTSIIEQNAQVFRDALRDCGSDVVLEHHSAFVDAPDTNEATDPGSSAKLRIASENWDAPVVVTTAVQFFESLFADRPARCRKLHNIANSVVILDEAQTLPDQLLRPCVAALQELARNYRASIVLCTATQPVLGKGDGFPNGLGNVRELMPKPHELYRRLKRVSARHVGSLDDATLAQMLGEREQALCIVNSRKHARVIYETLRNEEGAFHLSTYMHATHRRHVLRQVRARLAAGRPCRLVSTSLIEAGVDVDFPLVLRAEAGLDSIAQAAGRCNREGRMPPGAAEVRIFEPLNPDGAGPGELALYAQVFRATQRQGFADLLGLDAMRAYFIELQQTFGARGLDGKQVMSLYDSGGLSSFMQLPFETTARRFRMIEDASRPVIVPWSPEEGWSAAEPRALLDRLPHVSHVGSVARQLQAWIVHVPQWLYQKLLDAGALTLVCPDRYGEQFAELTVHACYDTATGLHWSEDGIFDPSRLVA